MTGINSESQNNYKAKLRKMVVYTQFPIYDDALLLELNMRFTIYNLVENKKWILQSRISKKATTNKRNKLQLRSNLKSLL